MARKNPIKYIWRNGERGYLTLNPASLFLAVTVLTCDIASIPGQELGKTPAAIANVTPVEEMQREYDDLFSLAGSVRDAWNSINEANMGVTAFEGLGRALEDSFKKWEERYASVDYEMNEAALWQLLYNTWRYERFKDPLESQYVSRMIRGVRLERSQALSISATLMRSRHRDIQEFGNHVYLANRSATVYGDHVYKEFMDVLEDCKAKGNHAPDDIIYHMINGSPDAALKRLIRLYIGDGLRWESDIRSGVGTLREYLWRQSRPSIEFADMDKYEADAKKGISLLAHHEVWWVNFYAVKTLQRHPELQDEALVGVLRANSHEIVRKSAKLLSSVEPKLFRLE